MLSRIVRGGLRHPRLILAAVVVFLIYGGLAVPTQKLDALPRLAPAQASVETEAPGMVAEQVEQLVTRPIETALIGAHGLASVHSQSIQGLSVVTLDFQSGADAYRVRQAISESLLQVAGALPAGIGSPRLSPLTSGRTQILKLGFTSDKLTPMELRDLAQWTLRPRLIAVPGIAGVQIFGGETRRIEVRARAGDLSDSDLGYADVFEAVRRATGVTGAGFIDTPAQRILIDPRGQALTDDDVAAGQIQVVGNAPVRISDVADVVDAPAPAFGDALIMGKPGVVVSLQGQYGANTLDTTHVVEATLAQLAPDLARRGVVIHPDLDRPASFASSAVREIVEELIVAAALLAVLLALVLRDMRAALVSLVSIPLAILITLLVFKALGWTLNTMTLGGLAVALGLIVDDAVLDVEHILSRLRDAEAQHASRTHAVLMASVEIRAPVIYATLLVVVALSPIVFLGGVQGALLRPLAVSIVVATLASLAVAIAITPALALLFLKHIGPGPEPSLLGRLKAGYGRLLVGVDRRPGVALGCAAVAIIAAATGLALCKTELLPTIHGGQLTAEIGAPASTSMAALRDDGQRIAQALLADPDVLRVSQLIGRAETGEDAWGPEHAQFDIVLKPGLTSRAQDACARRAQKLLDGYPGLHGQVRSGLGADTGGDQTSGKVRVRLYGDDLAALEAVAKRAAVVLAATPGARNVTAPATGVAPAVRVDLNFQRLAIYGLSAADVLDTVQTAFAGRRAAQVYQGGRTVDIAVTAQASLRDDPEGVGDLLLRSSSGVSVPLRSVANVYLTDGRTRIEHDNGLRSLNLLVDPPGDVAGFVQKVQARIRGGVSLPPGVYFEVLAPAGDAQPQHQLMLNIALAACAMVALLLIAFGDPRACAIILGASLFGLIGGAAAILLSGGVLSIGALMGFFPLFGLAARNAALLISRIEDLVTVDKAPWSVETVRQAALERLSPIAISALTIAVALAPFAIRADQPGHEILGLMVVVILGGLLTSTLLNLVLLPRLVFQVWRPPSASQS